MNRRFACFILSHGRPGRVQTVNALGRAGYTGEWYIVCDDEDETVDQYREAYGDRVYVFCKQEWFDRSDTCDSVNSPRSVILPARNYCFELARRLGVTHFLELDDDYGRFAVRGVNGAVFAAFDKFFPGEFDNICNLYASYLDTNERLLSVCFAQDGDYIGGASGTAFLNKVRYKAMNTFFCKTDKPFMFKGRINEDVTTLVDADRRGYIFLTIGDVSVRQNETQSNAGGMTDCYTVAGTYWKSFYSVVAAPSCVKIGILRDGHGKGTHARIHHNLQWDSVHPFILSEKWKKGV